MAFFPRNRRYRPEVALRKAVRAGSAGGCERPHASLAQKIV